MIASRKQRVPRALKLNLRIALAALIPPLCALVLLGAISRTPHGSFDLSSSTTAPPVTARCDQFINSLSRYASGSISHSSMEMVETWGIVQNDSLQELSKFYGAVRVKFASHDCRIQENFSRYWAMLLNGHLNAPDALEPKNVNYTNRLINLAFRTGRPAPVGDIADMYGQYLLENPDWSAALVRSPQIASVLMERLWMLSEVWKEPKLRSEAMTILNRRSPELLPLYQSLARSRSAEEFLKFVPTDAKAKPKYVHQAVRSALKHFLRMSPNADQIRKLALAMHDYNELFHIVDLALDQTRSASEFLRVSDYYYQPVTPEYATLVQKFLRPKYNSFLNLSPSSEEIGKFSKRVQGGSSDGPVFATALQEAKSASEFIRVAQDNSDSSAATASALSKTLESYIQKFAQLEPSADEINSFRSLLGKGISELQLLRFTLPKMVSAGDFLKLARFHGVDQERRGDAFSVSLRAILREHVEMFLAVNPTVDEINGYRQRTMDVETDGRLLEAALKTSHSAREALLAATTLGLEPPYSPTAFDEATTKVLIANTDLFIALKPTLPEIQIYRARMANPYADLKLVNYALGISKTRDEAFSIASRRPMVRTAAFEKMWSETLERNWPHVKRLMTGQHDAALFLREVPDRVVADRMKLAR